MTKSARHIKTRGFTLIEGTLVASLLAILFGLASPYLFGTKEKFILESDREKLIYSLKDAQQKAIAAYEGYDYQLTFSPPLSYTRQPENQTFSFHEKVEIENANPLTITFERLTGNPDSPLLVTLVSPKFKTEINVSSTGVITGSPPERR